jgi:putative resolvase
MALCSIGELAVTLGVSVPTLRRWHREGKLEPACRTVGGHRRYDRDRVVQAFGLHKAEGLTVAYARVSSHDQKGQLQTQAERLRRYCHERGWASLSIEDLGSGMNYKKKGLTKLMRLLLSGRVQRLVLVTKDRLLRFGAELLFRVCAFFNVEVIVLDADPAVPAAQRLTEDRVEILTVFSSRLYGARSRKNLKRLAV